MTYICNCACSVCMSGRCCQYQAPAIPFDNGVPCHVCGGTGRLYPFSRPWWDYPEWPGRTGNPWWETYTSDSISEEALDKEE